MDGQWQPRGIGIVGIIIIVIILGVLGFPIIIRIERVIEKIFWNISQILLHSLSGIEDFLNNIIYYIQSGSWMIIPILIVFLWGLTRIINRFRR